MEGVCLKRGESERREDKIIKQESERKVLKKILLCLILQFLPKPNNGRDSFIFFFKFPFFSFLLPNFETSQFFFHTTNLVSSSLSKGCRCVFIFVCS